MTFTVDYTADPVFGVVVKGPIELDTHSEDLCAGRTCLIHNPSKNHMSDWPLTWRADKGTMERQCIHGGGHPDVDDLAYHISQGNRWVGVHGCDGCCRR